ncbi:MAG TPA: hypothetical protein VH724_09870, partial [Candidatus Angelobacter sp.]|nr:hypothetical protein [Candidatus Angelobacter sp.]
MAAKCTHHHCNHVYQASAFGVAGELLRPAQHSIGAQAATSLASGGGRGFDRVENFQLDGILSFRAAYTEVGGSHDGCHDVHTSYAFSVIEKLNIADIVKADKVVSRVSVYSPPEGSNAEASFDITGSHFENLRICGHLIDIKLATHEFHRLDTFTKFEKAHQSKKVDHLFTLAGLRKLKAKELQDLEAEYHALHGITDRVAAWKKSKGKKPATASYYCSAAGHLDLKKHVGADSELQGHGSIICVPKFGVIHLAEVVIHQHHRQMNMLRVEMCSTADGA